MAALLLKWKNKKGAKRGAPDSASAMEIDQPYKKTKKDIVASSTWQVGEGAIVTLGQVASQEKEEE